MFVHTFSHFHYGMQFLLENSQLFFFLFSGVCGGGGGGRGDTALYS